MTSFSWWTRSGESVGTPDEIPLDEEAPECVQCPCEGTWETTIGGCQRGELDGLTPCTFPAQHIHMCCGAPVDLGSRDLFLRGQRTWQSQETRHYIHLDRSLMTFNTLHREHIRGEIVWNVLKVRVILDEKLSRSYTCHTPHGGVLRQDHGLDQIEI